MSNMKIEAMVYHSVRKVRQERLNELRSVLYEINNGPGAPPQVLARVRLYINSRVAELEAEGL